jgi:hypothetical protein
VVVLELVDDVLLVPVVPVPLVPVVPVLDVPVMPVAEVSVLLVIVVAEVSVDIVPVVPVELIAVSVDIVVDESVDELSVVAFVFSVLLQATPKSAMSATARKMASDFFIGISLLSELMLMSWGISRGITGSACLTSFALL